MVVLITTEVYFHTTQTDVEAVQNFEKAIDIDAKLTLGWLGKGFALELLARDDKGNSLYQRAVYCFDKQGKKP